nr:MAG TPA: hypothetical protein [Caudoviricetes sp.]
MRTGDASASHQAPETERAVGSQARARREARMPGTPDLRQ